MRISGDRIPSYRESPFTGLGNRMDVVILNRCGLARFAAILIHVNLEDVNGKKFALWLHKDAGESAVFSGTIQYDGHSVQLVRENETSVGIREEWYERIKPVPEPVRDILMGADFFLLLFISDLPSDADESGFESLGLRWPS
jgi:hypothetical protein